MSIEVEEWNLRMYLSLETIKTCSSGSNSNNSSQVGFKKHFGDWDGCDSDKLKQ